MTPSTNTPGKAHSNRFLKAFWIFIIGGVVGYFAEVEYCFLRTGAIESKQGILYGPFNQLYGFGALVLIFAVYPFAKMGNSGYLALAPWPAARLNLPAASLQSGIWEPAPGITRPLPCP